MVLIGGTRVYTGPRTESHLRSILARLQQSDDGLTVDISDLETLLDEIDGIIGVVDAEYDSTAVIGQPLYSSSNDNVQLANASALATSNVIGVAFADVTAGQVGGYITEGRVSKADWTAVTGSALLTPGSIYYLGTTVGTLTTTAPTTAGQVVIQVGVAVDTLSLHVAIKTRVRL